MTTRGRVGRISSIAAVATMVATLALPAPVLGVSFTVTKTADTNDGTCDADCSLREAVLAASGGGTNTVTVPAGTYTLTLGELAVLFPGANITLSGAGSATTIVRQSGATCLTSPGRVFDLDPGNLGSIAVTISGLTISNGAAQAPDGGGAIRVGGGSNDSLVLSDSVISDNCASSSLGGAGVSWHGTGSLTISDTTFSNNTAGGMGGALWSNTPAGATLTVTGSTFSGNTSAAAGGAGGAIALTPQSGQIPTFNINGNDFTGNSAPTAGGIGGAIYQSGGILNLGVTAANRFFGNSASFPTSGGLGVRGGQAAAANNWWGCNLGPTIGFGCDKADNIGGTLTIDPYVVLRNAPGASQIDVNQATTLTADVLHNSFNQPLTASQIGVLVGRPVAWGSSVRGVLSAEQTTIQANGTATATFTATSPGAGSANASLDNGGATAGVTINKADTSTTVTSDLPDPSLVGQSITVQYSVLGSHGNSPTAPTGDVTVSDGVDSCTGTAAAGQCSITLTTVGARNLTATYTGDANFNGSASADEAHTVMIPDTTPPVVSNVNTILREGGHIGSVSVTVSWSASDDTTPTDSLVFQLQRRRLRALGWTAWQDVATVTGQTSLYQVPLWHRYQYRVRAMDQAGNWSAYAEAFPITFIRRDERSFTRDASWTEVVDAAAMRGSVARSATAGGTASLTFTGNGVALVATTGPGQGTVQACLDPGSAGETCRTVDLSTLAAGHKQLPVVFSTAWATHTLRVTVISGTVDLDGAIFSR